MNGLQAVSFCLSNEAQHSPEVSSVKEICDKELRDRYLQQERSMASKTLCNWPFSLVEKDCDPIVISSVSEVFKKNVGLSEIFVQKGNGCRPVPLAELEPAIRFSGPQEIFNNSAYHNVRNISKILILSEFISDVNIRDIIYDYQADSNKAAVFVGWLNYANINSKTMTAVVFEAFLTKLDNDVFEKNYQSCKALSYLIGKIHDILLNALWFINEQPPEKRPELESALRKKIENIMGPIYASIQFDQSECVPPYLFQFEKVINELLAQGEVVKIDGQTVLLRHVAALTLLDYQFNLVAAIVTLDYNFEPMHQIQVMNLVYDHLGLHNRLRTERMNKTILVSGQILQTAALNILSRFQENYDPIKYLQEICLKTRDDPRGLRFSLFEWAHCHFTTHRELLDTSEGIAFLLKEAGVLKIKD